MKNLLWIAMVSLLVIFPSAGLSAMKEGHSGHGDTDLDHSGHSGKGIREVTVDGYALAYHLIDMREKMKIMKGMPEMPNTHHLMLYIKNPQGHPVQEAQVGYLIQGPTGEKQKSMSMGMGAGYGADVTMDKMGAYGIKTKIVIGDQKIMDRFEYHVH